MEKLLDIITAKENELAKLKAAQILLEDPEVMAIIRQELATPSALPSQSVDKLVSSHGTVAYRQPNRGLQANILRCLYERRATGMVSLIHVTKMRPTAIEAAVNSAEKSGLICKDANGSAISLTPEGRTRAAWFVKNPGAKLYVATRTHATSV